MASLPSPPWDGSLRQLEAVGIDTVVAVDHFTGGWSLEPVTALVAASQQCTRLRFQTGVLSNDYRHPVLVHRMIATADLLSGGRFELGIGAGWMRSDYDAAGIALDPPGRRIERLEEAVSVIKGLFGNEPFFHEGSSYRIRSLVGVPGPVQQHRPPIFIGGGGRRILAVAARQADIVGIHANLGAGAISSEVIAEMTLDRARQKIEWVEDAAEAAGRTLGDVELHMNFRFCRVTGTAAEGRAFAEKVAVQTGVAASHILRSPSSLIGPVDQCVETLQSRRELLGVSYVHFDPYPLPPGSWERLAEVIRQVR